MTAAIRVLVVDDHPVVRRGLRTVLSAERDIAVVGEASTSPEATRFVREHRVDVVLMDVRLADGDQGINATRQIRQHQPAPQVLMLSALASHAHVAAALAAGAGGYLLKDTPTGELSAAIVAAAHGRLVLSPAVAQRMAERMHSPQQTLTPRELDVLTHVASGHTNADIGRLLNVTVGMVKAHLVRTFTKLGVDTRTAAVAVARDRGFIE